MGFVGKRMEEKEKEKEKEQRLYLRSKTHEALAD
jgi:hypothetical protein